MADGHPADATPRERLESGLAAIVSDHNRIIALGKAADDYDKGEAACIRRTLKRLGFALEFDDDRTIKGVTVPDYVREQA